MASRRPRRPVRRRPEPLELPMTQGPSQDDHDSGLSPFVVIAAALFAGALLWALLPSGRPSPAPSSPPATRDTLPPARQAAPAAAQPAAVKPQASATKPIQRAAAGEPRAGTTVVPAARAWRAEGQAAELSVFGPKNKKVRTLRSEAGAEGWVKMQWDGKDEAGVKVPKGLYYLRPSAKGEQTVLEAWVD